MQEAVDFANKLLTGSVTPPPPPPPINGINLRVVKQDSKYIYFEWDQVAGAEGYLYLVNGRRVSRTFDPLQTHTRFAYDATAKYEVVAVNFNELARGAYSPSA